MKKTYLWLVLSAASSFVVSSGCAMVPRGGFDDADEELTESNNDSEDESDGMDSQAPDSAIREPTVSSLTLEYNQRIEKWIQYFSVTDRDRFQRFLNSGQKYRKIVENVLIENDLPPELYFLALIESGYQTHAISSAKAVGVWQFMPATGRRYGLQVNRHIDERRDPIRATEAAAKYLRDLYNIFGSWPLAMAAYNAGEYGVIRSILKGKTRDYWALVNIRALPRETSDYVAKLMAAATIGADPEKYGFKLGPGESFPELEAVEIPSRVPLSELSAKAGMGLVQLREFNPHLKGLTSPSHLGSYEIWFPKENALRIKASMGELARYSRQSKRNRSVARFEKPVTRRDIHRVRSGENLSSIARKYGTSARYLRKVNGLSSSGLIYPGMNLRITSRVYQPMDVVRYRVKKGENLDRIARKFGLSVRQVKDDNSLERNRIYPGQVLMIRSSRS